MFLKIQTLFIPPVLETDEQNTNRIVLTQALILNMLVASVIFMFVMTQTLGFEIRTILTITLSILTLVCYFLLRQKYVSLTGQILVIALWSFVTLIVLSSQGGVRAPVLSFFLVVVLSAGLLFRFRIAFIFTGLSLLVINTLYVSERVGLFRYNPTRFPLIIEPIMMSLTLLITISLLYVYVRQMNRTLHQLKSEINEREQVELQLRRSEARYRTLYNQTPVMLQSITPQGDLISVNDQWLKTLGYTSQAEVVGQKFTNFLTPASQHYALAVALPQIVARGTVTNVEYEMVNRSGELIDVLLNGILIRDQSGAPDYAQDFIVDVTAQKEAEESLRYYNARLQLLRDIDQAILLARSSPEIAQAALVRMREIIPCRQADVAVLDLAKNEGLILAVEPSDEPTLATGQRFTPDLTTTARLQSGRAFIIDDYAALPKPTPRTEILLAKGIRSAIRVPLTVQGVLIGSLNIWADQPAAFNQSHLDIAEEVARPMAIALQQARLYEQVRGYATELEKRVEQRTAEINERVIEVEQLNRGMLNILEDLQSANQQLAQITSHLEHTNAELESFAYSVSHDLRAPLRAISGFSQALLEDYGMLLDEMGQQYLQRVCAGAQRMGDLIDDLLMLSRITRQELHRKSVDLSSLARQIMVQYQHTQPDRTVSWSIASGLVAEVDAGLAAIVLENLLGNAWKFTGDTESAQITLGTIEQNQETLFFIKDNGAGFDMAYADKLFGPFQRLHEQTKFEGTGIGLATVQRVIHRHGGRIWAEAEVDNGATFYFTWG